MQQKFYNTLTNDWVTISDMFVYSKTKGINNIEKNEKRTTAGEIREASEL